MKPATKYVLLYLAYVAALHKFDGPWRHWKRDRADAIDPWTLTHLFWGALAQNMGVKQKEFMALGQLNEVVEYVVRKKRPDLLWGSPESTGNVLGDLAANWIGYKAGAL